MVGKNLDRLNFKAMPNIVNNEKVYSSCTLIKYNDVNARQERNIVLTEGAIYNVKKTQVKRRIPFEKLEAISISNASSEFVLHIKDGHDYRYLSFEHRTEIIETILAIMCSVRKLCTAFKVYELDLINLNSIMTTKNNFKEKKIVRPDEKFLKIMNLESFKQKEKEDVERASNTRKRTSMLYTKSKSDNRELCIDDFELLKTLGKGAFGKVVLALKKDNKKYLAIKILRKKHIIEMNQLEHTKAEKAILQHINHPFLVGLEYAFQTDEKLFFVLEFMQGGELFQHLRQKKRFPEKQAKFYAACITLGMGHLHNKNYIYRDLKLENLLLDEKGYAKLTDFGLAKFIESNEKALTFCGTPEYLAPEVILGKGHNRPADWWSLGILIYEMICGVPPFYSSNVQNMYRKAVKEAVAFKPTITISDDVKDIIQKLLEKDQTKRLGSQSDSLEIISHPWFSDMDFKKLLDRKLEAPFQPDIMNWEKNFDDEFINEKVRQSEARGSATKVDLEVLEKFQEEFNRMNFNKDVEG